jgi:2-methylcitrate dehydratase PrpD
MSTATPPAGEALAAFALSASWDQIAADVRHQAKRSFLNFVGCALGAAAEAPVAAAVRVLAAAGCAPQAGLVGRAERLDRLNAAFVNAIGGNLFDFDDTHLATVIHPTAPVAPVALALAEDRAVTGAAFLTALAVGIEVACRIGNAVSPGHYARGWHITATCGVFGAAATAARLLGLGTRETAHALGIAASESAGIVENLTTAAKNVGVGNAARNGLLAALMAQAGYEAAPTAIEGPLGWARSSGDAPDMDRIVGGLGRDWELLANTYKPYPSGIVLHAVADACLALREAAGPDGGEIASVTVAGDALLLARGDRVVRSARDARVSIQHTAAVALLRGAAGLDEYTAEAVADPSVATLRDKVRPVLDPDLPRGAARVEIALADGRRMSKTVRSARGSLELPMTDGEIAEKVASLAARGTPGIAAEAIIEQAWRLDQLADMRPFLRLLFRDASAG